MRDGERSRKAGQTPQCYMEIGSHMRHLVGSPGNIGRNLEETAENQLLFRKCLLSQKTSLSDIEKKKKKKLK